MADKSSQLLLEALSRAVAEPAGLPLYGTKAAPGLFAGGAAGRQAAQQCQEEGYLSVVRTEARGKNSVAICAITEKGLAYLLSQVNPKQVLEDFVRVLNERQAQAGALLQAAQHMQASIHALRAAAEKVLLQLHKPAPTTPPTAVSGNGSETWPVGILSFLARWQASGASEDCSLPELYRQAQQLAPQLTIGQFHDGLRRLYQREQIYLHPWTGPLYDLPEPPYALLAGHEIAYYASLRKNEER